MTGNTTGYVPPVPTSAPVQYDPAWMTLLCVVINALASKVNNAFDFTLTPSVGTTTITDPRISYNTSIGFTPKTLNAAADLTGLYVSSLKKGSAVIVHPNNANADKTYHVSISG